MIRSTESKANSELGVYCIARTMPVTIITTSTIPESEPADDPAHRTGACVGHGDLLADGHDGVAGEFVEGLACPLDLARQPQIQRRWALAYPPGGVVNRAVARAEPAAVLAAVVTGFLAEWDAAEMGADADDNQPFRFLYPVGILLWIAQLRDVDVLRGLDLLGRAMRDKDRLALPGDGQALTDLDRCQVHLGGGERQGVARRIEGGDERPYGCSNADAADRARGQNQEVAPGFTGMRFAYILLRDIGHSRTSYQGSR